MFQRILVPLDSSPLAECVLPHVLATARAFDARVTLLHVVTMPEKVERFQAVDPLEWQIRKAEGETYLRSVQTQLAEVGLETEAMLQEGDAAEQVVEYAKDHQADLIILSSHGQSGLSGWNVSSVVQKIILRAYTSMMIVRAYEPPQEVTGLRYRRVMVPLDGSQRAERVLPVVSTLARAHGSQVVLAHVVQRPAMPRRTPLSQEDSDLVERLVERNRAEAVRYLEDVRARVAAEDVETPLIISDRVASSLHELAEQLEVDLVLLSAHGHTAETRWPYGSVVISFVAYGTTPVLILQDVDPGNAVPSKAEVAAQDYGRR